MERFILRDSLNMFLDSRLRGNDNNDGAFEGMTSLVNFKKDQFLHVMTQLFYERTKTFILLSFFLAVVLSVHIGMAPSWASSHLTDPSVFVASENQSAIAESWYEQIETQWGRSFQDLGVCFMA